MQTLFKCCHAHGYRLLYHSLSWNYNSVRNLLLPNVSVLWLHLLFSCYNQNIYTHSHIYACSHHVILMYLLLSPGEQWDLSSASGETALTCMVIRPGEETHLVQPGQCNGGAKNKGRKCEICQMLFINTQISVNDSLKGSRVSFTGRWILTVWVCRSHDSVTVGTRVSLPVSLFVFEKTNLKGKQISKQVMNMLLQWEIKEGSKSSILMGFIKCYFVGNWSCFSSTCCFFFYSGNINNVSVRTPAFIWSHLYIINDIIILRLHLLPVTIRIYKHTHTVMLYWSTFHFCRRFHNLTFLLFYF